MSKFGGRNNARPNSTIQQGKSCQSVAINPRLVQQLQRNKRVFVDADNGNAQGESKTTRHSELKNTQAKQPRQTH